MPLPRYNYCLRGDSTPYFPFTAPSFWVPSHDIMSQASVTARNDVLSIMTLISGQCSGSKKLSNHLTLLAFCDWPAVMGRPAHVPQLFEANAYARVALPLRPHLPPPPSSWQSAYSKVKCEYGHNFVSAITCRRCCLLHSVWSHLPLVLVSRRFFPWPEARSADILV